jgi:hypothetical protein
VQQYPVYANWRNRLVAVRQSGETLAVGCVVHERCGGASVRTVDLYLVVGQVLAALPAFASPPAAPLRLRLRFSSPFDHRVAELLGNR